MLVETARLWEDLGFFSDRPRQVPHPQRHRAGRVHDRRQRQHLHQPDGAMNLWYAARVVELLEEYADAYAALAHERARTR